ncbi:TetR/AcrR family transcriptional regulator [Desulfovibrio aminophilus]|nr:TetR/AcrR family transcriptional regulator [Desulfovibrio aminophilus]MCM0754435.1 TetR/AcrR family transcriptional regulator [Desulfovibrio aminophilus]
MAGKRDEQLARRRDQILRAAAQVFRARGFHVASMAEISTAAGLLSPGTIYRYFQNKDALIQAVIETQYAHYAADVDALLGAPEAFARIFHMDGALLQAICTPNEYDPGLETELEFIRNQRLAEALEKAESGIMERMAAAVRMAQENGLADPGLDTESTALLLFNLIEGLVLDANYRGMRDMERMARTTRTLLRRFLRPEAVPGEDGRC